MKLFLVQLFFLLKLYIFLNHLTVQSNRIHAVTLRLKIITPVRLLAHEGKSTKRPNRSASFQDFHQLRNRQLRRNLHLQMNMIRLRIHLHYLTTQLLIVPNYTRRTCKSAPACFFWNAVGITPQRRCLHEQVSDRQSQSGEDHVHSTRFLSVNRIGVHVSGK